MIKVIYFNEKDFKFREKIFLDNASATKAICKLENRGMVGCYATAYGDNIQLCMLTNIDALGNMLTNNVRGAWRTYTALYHEMYWTVRANAFNCDLTMTVEYKGRKATYSIDEQNALPPVWYTVRKDDTGNGNMYEVYKTQSYESAVRCRDWYAKHDCLNIYEIIEEVA